MVYHLIMLCGSDDDNGNWDGKKYGNNEGDDDEND